MNWIYMAIGLLIGAVLIQAAEIVEGRTITMESKRRYWY